MKEVCCHEMRESKMMFEVALVENVVVLTPVLKNPILGTHKMTAFRRFRFRSFGLSYQMM